MKVLVRVEADTIIANGGGMLHCSIKWPKDASVVDLAKGFELNVWKFLKHSEVHLILNGISKNALSLIPDLRESVISNACTSFQLRHHYRQKKCAFLVQRQKNLIEIIAIFLLQKFLTETFQHRLIVISRSIHPVETIHGLQIKRQNLKAVFDEADYIISQQVSPGIE